MNSKRNWTVYELNQLLAHHKSINHLDNYGDTPVEYITGHAQFCDHDFVVTPDVLIPRYETEELVSRASLYIKQNFQPSRLLTILDIGTGSGCIGISLFHQLSKTHELLNLILIDNSQAALKIAQLNLERLIQPEARSKFQLIQSDLLTQLPDTIKIDVIVANLPYISDEFMEKLPISVKSHEPNQALGGGGSKGLGLINQMLVQVVKLTHLPKSIWLEVDEYVQTKDLKIPSGYSAEIFRDQFEKVRFVLLSRE